jgi:hypothetical protein
MLLTEINVDDLNKLDRVRLDRLACFFTATLPCCEIQIEIGNILIIHCPNSTIANDLVEDIEDLSYYGWLVLGVRSIGIYLANEEILRTKIYE